MISTDEVYTSWLVAILAVLFIWIVWFCFTSIEGFNYYKLYSSKGLTFKISKRKVLDVLYAIEEGKNVVELDYFVSIKTEDVVRISRYGKVIYLKKEKR